MSINRLVTACSMIDALVLDYMAPIMSSARLKIAISAILEWPSEIRSFWYVSGGSKVELLRGYTITLDDSIFLQIEKF